LKSNEEDIELGELGNDLDSDYSSDSSRDSTEEEILGRSYRYYHL